MAIKKRIIKTSTYVHKVNDLLANVYMTNDAGYVPLSVAINEMIARGEISKDLIDLRAKELMSSISNPNTEPQLSIMSVKGVDGLDVDSYLNQIKTKFLKEFKNNVDLEVERRRKSTEKKDDKGSEDNK
nr:MAG: hypothetical protein [Microvirus Sku113]